jgi:hypothetical protein
MFRIISILIDFIVRGLITVMIFITNPFTFIRESRMVKILFNVNPFLIGLALMRTQLLFGILDQRTLWQKVRIYRRKNSDVLMPGTLLLYDPLEVSKVILEELDKFTIFDRFKYAFFLLIRDEGRSITAGNHGISSSLALALLIPKLRRYYFMRALLQYRCNQVKFCYFEGSTHYHVFTVSLFINYFKQLECRIPQYFSPAIRLSYLFLREDFYIGDFDGDLGYLKRIYDGCQSFVDLDNSIESAPYISQFNFLNSSNFYVISSNYPYKFGHSHRLRGSFFTFYKGACLFLPVISNFYTDSLTDRRKDRCLSNFPTSNNYVKSINRFFGSLPNDYIIIKENDTGLHISNDTCIRIINFNKGEIYDSFLQSAAIRFSIPMEISINCKKTEYGKVYNIGDILILHTKNISLKVSMIVGGYSKIKQKCIEIEGVQDASIQWSFLSCE